MRLRNTKDLLAGQGGQQKNKCGPWSTSFEHESSSFFLHGRCRQLREQQSGQETRLCLRQQESNQARKPRLCLNPNSSHFLTLVKPFGPPTHLTDQKNWVSGISVEIWLADLVPFPTHPNITVWKWRKIRRRHLTIDSRSS